MADPVFFTSSIEPTLAEIAALAGAVVPDGIDPAQRVSGVAALDRAMATDLTFIDDAAYLPQLRETRAGACLTAARHAGEVPAATVALVCARPHDAYVAALRLMFPAALRPEPILASGLSQAAHIDPLARLEDGVTVEAGAVIGAGAEIGRGSIIGPGAVVGPGVRIGRDCHVGAGVTLTHALIGNRVILHPGVRIGQDGFGYLMSARGHAKIPQIGRVVIQDDVEIGANSTVDRGANRDTVIGEGTKIDNQVQIGHNVEIGRHCVIVSQVGISGSARLEDFVSIGGQAGINGHVTIGRGAQVAATAIVKDNLAAGGRYGGVPARPIKEWFREELALRRLVRRSAAPKDDHKESEGQ